MGGGSYDAVDTIHLTTGSAYYYPQAYYGSTVSTTVQVGTAV